MTSLLLMNAAQRDDGLYLEPGEVPKPSAISRFGRNSFFPFRGDRQ